jgi:hypothetical protein
MLYLQEEKICKFSDLRFSLHICGPFAPPMTRGKNRQNFAKFGLALASEIRRRLQQFGEITY